MPPVRTSHGRASKACEACRARKTRCYESAASKACLRCTTLRVPCSLDNVQSPSPLPSVTSHSNTLVDQNYASCIDRISRLESTVQTLISTVARLQEPHPDTLIDPRISDQHELRETRKDFAPLAVIQDAAEDQLQTNHNTDPEASHRLNVVAKGIITKPQAEELLGIFWSHYGRWVGMEESQDSTTDFNNFESPLLLCACCLIAVRHSGFDSANAIASNLFREAKTLLGEDLLETRHSLEFFQAILVLSLWSTTLGQRLLSVDAWLLTGFALQHAVASDVFSVRLSESDRHEDAAYSRSISVYNHLCLAHLHSCVTMRRKSMVSQSDLARARLILHSDSAANFAIRMVAELHLYSTIYEQCIVNEVSLPRAKQALQAWKVEWAFLFDQPRRQFLQTSFFFAGLLIYENSLSSKSAAVRESIVADMVRLASDILKLFMDTADERTKHLTDHVYHVVTFAAVTLCRLACRYESQLSSRIDLPEIDRLVSETIHWLNAIDDAPHISQLMSRLIGNVQRRLRPTQQDEDDHPQLETETQGTFPEADVVTNIPDFLGMEDYFEFDWDAIIPDWQSLESADFGNDILSPL